MVRITPRQIFKTRWKSPSHHQFPIPLLGGEMPPPLSPLPLEYYLETLACLTFQSQLVELISTHFSVWLWTVTQFNTRKNEKWKKGAFRHREWVFNTHMKILNLNFKEWKCSQDYSLKGCWLVFYPNLCVGISLGFS